MNTLCGKGQDESGEGCRSDPAATAGLSVRLERMAATLYTFSGEYRGGARSAATRLREAKRTRGALRDAGHRAVEGLATYMQLRSRLRDRTSELQTPGPRASSKN